MLSPDAKQALAAELIRIVGELSLSDDQKSELHGAAVD